MDKLPYYMRIAKVEVLNEDVDSRRKAITKLAGRWGKKQPPEKIVAKVADIANALSMDELPPGNLPSEIETAVQEYASAFLSSDAPLEVGICAGLAVLTILDEKPLADGLSTADFYSNAFWSALAFQPPLNQKKREELRNDLFVRARERSRESANTARQRMVVPDVPDLKITQGEEGNLHTDFKKMVTRIVDPLRKNAVLDREELDFLWWAQLDRSRVLDKKLVDIPEETRLVAMGIEAAGLLRRLPADVHHEIVLRTIESDYELDLADLLAATGEHRDTLAAQIPKEVVHAAAVFPLLHALKTGEAIGNGALEKRRASTWGTRALLETTLARLIYEGAAEL